MDRSRRVVSRRGATRSFSGFRARGVDVSHHTLTVYTYEEPNATPTFLSVHRTARDVTRTAASSQRPTKRFAFARSHSCPQSLSSARRRAIRPSAWTLRLTLDERRTVSSVHHLIPPVGADRRVPIDAGLENKTRPRLTTTTTPTRSRTLSPVRAARSTRSRRTNENNRPQPETSSFRKLQALRIVQCEPLSVRVLPLPGVRHHTVPVETGANKSGVSHGRARLRCRRMKRRHRRRESAHTHAHRTRQPT